MKINNNNYILRFEFSVAEIFPSTKSEIEKNKMFICLFKKKKTQMM